MKRISQSAFVVGFVMMTTSVSLASISSMFSSEAEDTIRTYGLSLPSTQSFVDVTRRHCQTVEDKSTNLERYKKGFQNIQEIFQKSHAHFKEQYKDLQENKKINPLDFSVSNFDTLEIPIYFPRDPYLDGPSEEKGGGGFSRALTEENCLNIWASYALDTNASISSLKVKHAFSKTTPQVRNLEDKIKDETITWVFALSLMDSALEELRKIYAGALKEVYLHERQIQLSQSNPSANKVMDSLQKGEFFAKIFQEAFREPKGIADNSYEIIQRGFWNTLSYLYPYDSSSSDRSNLVRLHFHPLLQAESVTKTVKKFVDMVFKKTQNLEKETVQVRYEKAVDLVKTAFSETEKLVGLIPSFDDYARSSVVGKSQEPQNIQLVQELSQSEKSPSLQSLPETQIKFAPPVTPGDKQIESAPVSGQEPKIQWPALDKGPISTGGASGDTQGEPTIPQVQDLKGPWAGFEKNKNAVIGGELVNNTSSKNKNNNNNKKQKK